MKCLGLLTLLLSTGPPAHAEESSEEAPETIEEEETPEVPPTARQAIVTLKDGQVLRGRTWRNSDRSVGIALENGAVMELEPEAIRGIQYPDAPGASRFAYPDPSAARYFFAPTAIPLKRDSTLLAQKMLVVTEITHAVSDNVSLMGATSLPLLLFGLPNIFFGAKVSAPAGDGFWAGGGVWGAVFDGEVFALPFGNVTFGTPDKNLTLGAGYGFMADAVADSTITVVIAGSTRLNDKIALVTENWIFAVPDRLNDPLIALSGGVRFINRQLTADLALMSLAMPNQGEFLFVPIPWLDLAWRFR